MLHRTPRSAARGAVLTEDGAALPPTPAGLPAALRAHGPGDPAPGLGFVPNSP